MYSLLLEFALNIWIKRAKRKDYDRKAAETTLIRAVERRFDLYWKE